MNLKIKEEEIFNASTERLADLNKISSKLSWDIFGRKLKAYYPNTYFPSISITGTQCAQNCLYCDKHYLKNMVEINNPEKLWDFAKKLVKRNGKGMLISGGYDENSKIPIKPYLKIIKKIIEEMNLKINVHSGLVNKYEAKQLFNTGINAVSFDLITDDVVIQDILQSNRTGNDYIKSYNYLIQSGLNVIPHICLGLYYGQERGNLDAIKIALNSKIKLIVFLGLIPTKGTPMANSKTIEPIVLNKMILYTRFTAPYLEQSLGCMRVRMDDYEKIAIETGVNRIAVPKIKSLELAKKYELEVEKIESCCAI